MSRLRPAPELEVSVWLNSPQPITLQGLAGKVVLIEAFQMLCPGCVEHGLPQASRVRATFSASEVAVLGLHSVFEHHEAQGSEAALKAFLHEYRIGFPVGIDQQNGSGQLPRTMAAYRMQGTPTLILIDRFGRLRAQHFGHVSDLVLGAEIQLLIGEPLPAATTAPLETGCTPEGCVVPANH
jgi:hypothetical protein